MANRLRIDVEGYPSFVTTKTNKNIPYFRDSESAQSLIQILYFCRQKGWFYLMGFVLMPDHLHIIFMPKDKNSSQIMHSIKSYSANEINKKLRRNGNLWQRSFWEHKIPDREILFQKIQYIYENPIRKGLCETPESYPFSSANPKYETDMEIFL